MQARMLAFLGVACLTGLAAASVGSSASMSTLGITFHVPNSLSAMEARRQGTASNTEITQCVQFVFRRTRRYAGEVCASIDPDFLRDRGVTAYDSVPLHARTADRPESGLVVASAMSQYPLESFIDRPVKANGAVIDCDEGDGVLYRATASCHVAVSSLPNGKMVYSNFIVKTHTTGKAGLAVADVKRLWDSMDLGAARSAPFRQ
jgi:hypothetical protein